MKYSHLKTLLVDDDEVVQMLVQHRLNSLGIECSLASTGTEAIEALGKKTFDFIIMDINMPGQDGIDSVRWIRELISPEKRDLPIFALTSFSTKSHTVEILNAGFNEHLTKPFDLNAFIPFLEKYFWKTVKAN